MANATVTIDRDPRSLFAGATEADVERYRILLEDTLSRALPDRAVRVVLGDTLAYSGECLTADEMRAISRLWLAVARELDAV